MQQVIDFLTTNWVWIALAALYICNVLLGHRSQLDAWVLKHPKVGGVLKIIRGALPGDPWLIISGLTLVIKGTLPAKLTPIADVITAQPEEKPPGA